MMEPTSILSILAVLAGWTGFSEWRVRTMYTQLKEKIEDKQAINQAVQQELKDQMGRLEDKIDMLIQLNLQAKHTEK